MPRLFRTARPRGDREPLRKRGLAGLSLPTRGRPESLGGAHRRRPPSRPMMRSPGRGNRRPAAAPEGRSRSAPQPLAPAAAPLSVIAWNRIGLGPRPGDLAAFDALGASDDARLEAFVDQQLAPELIDDSEADARIAAAGFTTLEKTLPELWADHVVADPPWEERMRPITETLLATFTRAVYGRRQLVEVLADFWHNHFNIYGWEFWEGPTWVYYDRDVIRGNLLGNFRTMLEMVAKSTPMLVYLDNWLSSADGPNENFSREMLELMCLGDENYFGAVPRSQVPVDGEGKPTGFCEEDVFAVTRCLTGWSLAGDPWWNPETGDGTFFYRHDWHDTTEKNVLGTVIPAGQGEQDGLTVLDLLATHPGTGRHIAGKLCRRLIGDNPSPAVVNAAAAVFTEQAAAPDQLAQVVRTILLSDEFKSTWGGKVKRPFEIVVSALRAGGADFPFVDGDSDTNTFDWLFYNTGQYLFAWHPPNGYPDATEAWVSSGPRVMTWRLVNWLADVEDDAGGFRIDAVAQTPPGVRSANALVDFWIDRVLGRALSTADRDELVEFMAQGHNPDFDLPLDTDEHTLTRLQALVGLIFMSPEFLWR